MIAVRWSQLGVFALVTAVAMLGFASLVSAEGGTVRYSYEEVEVGGESGFALLPRGDDGLSGEVTTSMLERAFETLRADKRGTYGNSYASVSGNAPEGARAEVHIDSDHAQYAPIIMAESVYTLTEFGVPEVHFPGFADEGLTRADISFPAYTLTLPLWEAVPPGSLTTAQVRTYDDELVAIRDVYDRWRRDQGGVIDDVYAFLDSSDSYTVRSVLRALPDIGDVRVGSVTPLLDHDERRVRSAALGALEGHEHDGSVLAAVSSALQGESSSSLARDMAEFLGESNDDEYAVELPFYLLEHGDDDEALSAAEELGGWTGDDRVVDLLGETLRDERTDVAEAAAASLDELDAHDVRRQALDDSAVANGVRHQIAEDLASTANPDAVRLAGLDFLATHRSGGHANRAIRQMSQLPIDEARRAVENYLDDDSRGKRRAAVDALVERNDVASVEALMEVADGHRDEQALREAADEIMVAQSLDEIISQTDATSSAIQEVAYRAIGERAERHGGRDRAVRTISQGTDHRDAAIRGAAAASLGQLGGDDALSSLGEMVGDRDPVVRQNVARALGQFDTDDYADTLVEYLDDGDPGVVAAAIDALENRGDSRAADRIDDMRDHADPRVRASALRAVTTFLPDRTQETVRQHIGRVLSGAVGDDAREVRISALEQLGRFEDSGAVTNIAARVGSDDTAIRIHAIRALANTGHDDARPLVESALTDDEPEVRREAIEALAQLAGSAARPELEARLEEEEDPEVVDLLEAQLQEI